MCEHHYGLLKLESGESARSRQQKLDDTDATFDDVLRRLM